MQIEYKKIHRINIYVYLLKVLFWQMSEDNIFFCNTRFQKSFVVPAHWI